MDEYRKPYFILLSASEKALRAMDKANYGIAQEILIKAQREAEDIIISQEENTGD